jgi:hypothetical protein
VKKITVAKSKEVNIGYANSGRNWTSFSEFSKGGYGLKRAVLSMMMINIKT